MLRESPGHAQGYLPIAPNEARVEPWQRPPGDAAGRVTPASPGGAGPATGVQVPQRLFQLFLTLL